MAKIKGARRTLRDKATPSDYPLVGPVELERAYSELPTAAFAMWIRLMVEPVESLYRGRLPLAKLLGYSKRQSDTVLRTLERFGYVTFISRGKGHKTQISIQRRCIIGHRDHFIRAN